jgi:hypothetical protein
VEPEHHDAADHPGRDVTGLQSVPLPDPAIVTANAGAPGKVSPQAGMTFPVVCPADPTGRAAMGAQVLCYLPSQAYGTAIPAAGTFSTAYITYAALDMTISSFTGGSVPTVNFYLERQGADSNWYQILSTGGLNSAPQSISVDISPGLNGAASGPLSSTVQHNVFTQTARLRWAFGGSVAPTSVTFSASVIGR